MRNRALAIGLSAGLAFGTAACSKHSSHETQPSPTFKITPEPRTPTTLPADQLIEQAEAAWSAAAKEFQQHIIGKSALKLSVSLGNCLYWPAEVGYTVVKNPATFELSDRDSQLFMFTFVNGAVKNNPVPLNGPYQYSKLDSNGDAEPQNTVGNMDAVKFLKPIGLFKSESFIPTIFADGTEGWIGGNATGDRISETFVIPPNASLSAALIKICGQDFSSSNQTA